VAVNKFFFCCPESARKKFDHQFSVVDVDDSKSLSYQEFVMLVLLMFHED